MRNHVLGGLAASLLLLAGEAAIVRAAFLPIGRPDAAYTGSTTNIPITAPDLSLVSSLSDPALTMTFSTAMQARTVPRDWGFWSAPPETESDRPRLLYSFGAQTVTLTFSQPLQTFGVEVMPNETTQTYPLSAVFFNGTSVEGTIVRDVQAGARLLAATTTEQFTSVRLTVIGSDFGAAQLRYNVAAAPVPEPSALLLGGTAVLGLAVWGRWRRRRAVTCLLEPVGRPVCPPVP